MVLLKPENRIRILSTLAIIAYILFVATSFINGKEDFSLGYNQSRESIGTNDSQLFSNTLHYVSLKAKNGASHFPSTVNSNMNTYLHPAKHVNIKILRHKEVNSEINLTPYNTLEFICIIAMGILAVVLPIQFFLMIGDVKRNYIFSRSSAKTVRFMGAELVLLYAATYGVNYATYQTNCLLFDFSDYLVAKPHTDVLFLVLGIAVLIIAEVLQRGSEMKMENDLTV
ncbi:MAG: DUF2975 domain-containing protein [Bacteroidales bacterium]|nr:DUF2975 domain-containing protein [Bacteroidales bacterium]MBN2749079.1 DUF2975 domain-containing protein [Bacteroidales bacterium]